MKLKVRFIVLLILCWLSTQNLVAQRVDGVYQNRSGYLSLGVRNSVGMFFTEGKTYFGKSVGGQFGLRFGEAFHSRWFGDFITTNFGSKAQREDVHGGFSFMPEFPFSKINKSSAVFYPLAGFCIDYTKITINVANTITTGPRYAKRYSFATQFGVGIRLPISPRLDFSFETHYMLHIGTDIDLQISGNEVEIEKSDGTNLEGHLLFAASIEYKLFKLWGRTN